MHPFLWALIWFAVGAVSVIVILALAVFVPVWLDIRRDEKRMAQAIQETDP